MGTDDQLSALLNAPAFMRPIIDRILDGSASDFEAELCADPTRIFRAAGLTPDPWQVDVLTSQAEKTLLLGSRQCGKSLSCAAMALRVMILEAPALVLVIGPGERQAGEFVGKVKDFYYRLPIDQVPEATGNSALQLHLANGSRIIGLPDSEGKIRCYSAPRIIFYEEASRIPDALRMACTPMMATTKLPKEVALSTPFVHQGWFWEAWSKGRCWPEHPKGWYKMAITADKCSRITPEFLEDQRANMTEEEFQQEFQCRFTDPEGAYFSEKEVAQMFDLGKQFAEGMLDLR